MTNILKRMLSSTGANPLVWKNSKVVRADNIPPIATVRINFATYRCEPYHALTSRNT